MTYQDRPQHLVPSRDVLVHVLNERCISMPTKTNTPAVPPPGWVWKHHALDGRKVEEETGVQK